MGKGLIVVFRTRWQRQLVKMNSYDLMSVVGTNVAEECTWLNVDS